MIACDLPLVQAANRRIEFLERELASARTEGGKAEELQRLLKERTEEVGELQEALDELEAEKVSDVQAAR